MPARDGSPGIALSAVSHGFDDTAVLEDVTLAVEPGETLVIIGPSGTGKTTTLRLLGLFAKPEVGTVAMGERDVWALPEPARLAIRRRIGMVFQTANLFDASVRTNVRYGLHIRRAWSARVRRWFPGGAHDRIDSAVTDALAIVGLGDAAEQPARSLSGGEAQRVAFARAIAYDPDVLLLDEPTSDLDPRNTAVIEDAIGTAQARGMAVAVATHDMHQAERIADRVAVMLDGRLIEVGPADRVFSEPHDPRAGGFIDGELVY